jgi:hypothetical protein
VEAVHPVTAATILILFASICSLPFHSIACVEQTMPVALSDTASSSEQSQELPSHPRPHTRDAFPALEHFRVKDIPPAAY